MGAYDDAGYFQSWRRQCISSCATDTDSDSVPDINDPFPEDPNEWSDFDNDQVGDFSDNCPFDKNDDQLDYDGDSFGNVCDLDADADGVLNFHDALPLDETETLDTDGDGIGNNADNDDDGDGWDDDNDAFPLDPSEYLTLMKTEWEIIRCFSI